MTSENTAVARKPRVWVLDQNAFDYSPAEAYGEIVSLRSAAFSSGAGDDWNREIIHSIRKQLIDYVPMEDYLIPTGKPLKMCAISLILRDFGDKHLFLAWDAMHYRYVKYEVDVGRDFVSQPR
jgi:hypothetical protein